jgi:hypothetical protein
LRESRLPNNVRIVEAQYAHRHRQSNRLEQETRAMTEVNRTTSFKKQARKLNDNLAAAADNLARLERQETPTVSSL